MVMGGGRSRREKGWNYGQSAGAALYVGVQFGGMLHGSVRAFLFFYISLSFFYVGDEAQAYSISGRDALSGVCVFSLSQSVTSLAKIPCCGTCNILTGKRILIRLLFRIFFKVVI